MQQRVEFRKKIDAIINAETPEIQTKLINKLYRECNFKTKKKSNNEKIIIDDPSAPWNWKKGVDEK